MQHELLINRRFLLEDDSYVFCFRSFTDVLRCVFFYESPGDGAGSLGEAAGAATAATPRGSGNSQGDSLLSLCSTLFIAPSGVVEEPIS